jgi:chromate transporter
MNMSLPLSPQDWFDLFMHFAVLSLMGIGGAITTAPEMHRFLVDDKHWLTDESFSSCIALAQSAPGPNVLFVALMGWQVGINAGGGLSAGATAWWLGLLGVILTMVGIMLPSSILTYKATKWAQVNRDLIAVQSFKSGMAPIVIGLLVSTGWLLSAAHRDFSQDWKIWLITAMTSGLMLKTSIHLLWLVAAGGILGAAGLL